MEWARQRDAVVLTHDLDFGATLALSAFVFFRCKSELRISLFLAICMLEAFGLSFNRVVK
jgi:hypothetical protein